MPLVHQADLAVDVVDVVYHKLAHPAHQDLMEAMVKMVLQVKLDLMDKMVQLPLLNPKLIGASNALMLQLVLLVTQDLKALPVMLVLLVLLLMVVLAVLPVHPALLDLLDKLDQTEMLVPLVLLVLLMMFPAQKDLLVHQDPMDNLALLDLLDPMDNPDKPEVMDHPVMLEVTVPQVNQEQTVMQALMVNLALVVNAHTVLHHVPLQVIKPNNHLKDADVLLKAWFPIVESAKSFFFSYLFYILGHRHLWRSQK